MAPRELEHIYDILVSFLGESKSGFNDSMQFEFPCPKCRELNGPQEDAKYNLSVSLTKQMFQCWKCSSHDDTSMKGSIQKLFKMYASEALLSEYIAAVEEFRSSKLFKLKYGENDFSFSVTKEDKEVELPRTYISLKEKVVYGYDETVAIEYLNKRGIGWDIINKYNIGYTLFDAENPKVSNRILLPSYDENGRVNYWTGRDYTSNEKRQKYFNPRVERKDIIFNESKIEWDADITLVEGPFDHIVVPNSIPLLGKVLKTDFKIYDKITKRANANVNIFLDGDAQYDVRKIYRLLDHDRLNGKIRVIPASGDEDASSIFEKEGKKGILKKLSQARKVIFL